VVPGLVVGAQYDGLLAAGGGCPGRIGPVLGVLPVSTQRGPACLCGAPHVCLPLAAVVPGLVVAAQCDGPARGPVAAGAPYCGLPHSVAEVGSPLRRAIRTVGDPSNHGPPQSCDRGRAAGTAAGARHATCDNPW
jgi:hypothetical protein